MVVWMKINTLNIKVKHVYIYTYTYMKERRKCLFDCAAEIMILL